MLRSLFRSFTCVLAASSATFWFVGCFQYNEVFVQNPLGKGELHLRSGSDGIAFGYDLSASSTSFMRTTSTARNRAPDYLGWRPRYFSYGAFACWFIPHWLLAGAALVMFLSRYRRPGRATVQRDGFCLSDYPQLQNSVARREAPGDSDSAG